MAMESSLGLMAENMWANIQKTRNKAKESSNGQMAENMMESGMKANNMDKVITPTVRE